MAQFRIAKAYAQKERGLFVLEGSVVDGEILSGMVVHLPFNRAVSMTAPVHSVEHNQHRDREEITLCIKCDEDQLQLWEGLNVGDETIHISEDAT